MCFSPEASFIASAGLATAGIASLAVAPKEKKILAAIPFAFAAQQALEGVQWLCLRSHTPCTAVAYGFLFFALILWPSAIPAVVYMLDKESRSVVQYFLALGVLVSLYFLAMVSLPGVSALEMHGSILYQFESVFQHSFGTILYAAAVAGPLLVSRIRFFRLFGALVLLSASITYYFFTENFVSIWCFFAAVLSVAIFAYLLSEKRNCKKS